MILVFAVSPRLIPVLAPSLAAAALAMLGYAFVLGRGPKAPSPTEENPGRAFDFAMALMFVAIVGVFTAVSRLLTIWLGDVGAVVGGAVTGVADAHAAGVSMATLNSSKVISDSTATLGVLVG